MSGSLSPQAAALADQGIRWVAITWVNHAGSALVKVVPLSALDAAVGVGVGFSPVADAFCSDGGIDPAHRLARPDGDLRLRADGTALALLESASGWAWAPGLRWDRALDQPYAADQRQFCLRQAQRLEQVGLNVLAGFELEWCVFSGQEPAVAGGPYGADRLVDGLDYASALLEALEAAELPWLQFHPEFGAGQFELSLAPGSVLEAADRLVRAKLVIQRQTSRFGWQCSFSPKPRLEGVGNGGHLHLSVSRDGQPVLQGGDGPSALTAEGAALIAALLEHLPALLPIACPLAESYERLAPGSWSAPFQAWGVENRETALRLVPSGADGGSAHLEIKVCDLAANPYLLLGAVQSVVLEGLEHPLPLPQPVRGDPALLSPGEVPRLPRCLADAAAAFASSSLLQQAMGEALHGSLLDSQAAEVRRSRRSSTQPMVESASIRRRPVVGVMGAGEAASPELITLAEELGACLAQRGWVVLSGGRDCGVMAAVSRGAAAVPGHCVVGILPDDNAAAAAEVDLAISTGLGQARNVINVLASDAVVICGAGGPGTASEAAHALKAGKPLFLLRTPAPWIQFFQSLDGHVQVFAEVDLLLTALDQADAELSPPASAIDPTTQP